MTGMIVLALIGYFTVKACLRAKAARAEANRKKQIDHLYSENKRRMQEAKEFEDRWVAYAKQAEKEQERLCREQERERKEREREEEKLWKEQLRLRREQEKQTEQLAKHEKRIADLEHKMSKAEDEIIHFSDLLEILISKRDEMSFELGTINRALLSRKENLDPTDIAHNKSLKQFDGGKGMAEYMEAYVNKGNESENKKAAKEVEKMQKRKAVLEEKLISQNNKIFSAQQKIKNAQHIKEMASREIEAA